MEDRSKSKGGARRRPATRLSMAAASSPIPGSMSSSNACGHDGCGGSGCSVRYVGPVSHIRDHHALHAARGVAHVWTAAVVSGLAVVLTGVVAYNAQAATPRRPAAPSAEMRAIMERLDRMERVMHEMAQTCFNDGQGEPEDRADADTRPSNDEEEIMKKKRLMEEEARRENPPSRREPASEERRSDREVPPPGGSDAGGSGSDTSGQNGAQ